MNTNIKLGKHLQQGQVNEEVPMAYGYHFHKDQLKEEMSVASGTRNSGT